MAKHDIVLLNTTSSGFETDLGSNVARIKGTADDLFQVRDGSGINKLAVSSVENSMIVSGDLTLTGNLSSSLSSTASFGRIDVTKLTGDASQMTNVNQIGHVSSSKQLAARISGAFQHGFELIGENRVISGSATSTGSFTRVFANVYSGDASDMFDVDESGHFSGSAQLASNVSGSFTSGFLYAGTISGSATSTGSFGKVEIGGKVFGNAAGVTIDESGFFSGSAQLASNISGSFNKGFEFSGALTATQILTASYVGVSGSAFAYAGNATTMSISSICGSDFDYRLEDAITAGKIKGTSYGTGVWSSGPNRNDDQSAFAAVGTQNAYLSAGGYKAPKNGTEKYDGTAWSLSANMSIENCTAVGFGTQNAAAIAGGQGDYDGTELYNGSTYSDAGNMGKQRRYGGSAGTQNAGLVFSGTSPSPASNTDQVDTETFDGNAWTEVNNLNVARGLTASGGTQNAAIIAGGYAHSPGALRNCSEIWNGTNWTAISDMNQTHMSAAGIGTQNHFIVAGGNFPSTSTRTVNTEEWNGTSWSEVNNLGTARNAMGGAAGGLGSAGIVAGGQIGSPTATNTVELWNAGLSTTASFGRIDVDSILGDASQTTGLEQALPSGVISGSAQIASKISGSFTSGFLVDGTVSGSATSTGSFGKYEFGSSISITDISGLTGVPSSEGFISGSKQIASQISGSFNKGFEFTGTISGSATSTGSFGRVVANTYNADASNVTGFTLPSGIASGSAGFASQISGSFKGGFEMIEGGVISSSIKFISSSLSSSATQEVGMGQGNDGSTSMSIASASFSIGLANFANLKINDGAVTSISHRTKILNQGILSKGEKFISGSLRGLPRFRQDALISGSATSTGSYAKLRAESITLKDIVGDTRKSISGSMNHATYTSGSFRSIGTDKPIKIPVRGRVDHTLITKQFTASGSMENQKYRTQPGQLFVDNWGRLNMTVQTGSMVTVQPGAWTLVGSGEAMGGRTGGMIAQSTKAALVLPAIGMDASCTRIFDGITVFGGATLLRPQYHCGWSHAYQGIGNGVNDGLFAGGGFGGGMGRHGQCYNGVSWSMIVCLPQDVYSTNGQPKAFNAPGVTTGGGGALVGGSNRCKVYEWTGVSWEIGGTRNVNIGGGGAAGTVYAGLAFGGDEFPSSTATTCTEEYNGVSWSTANAMPHGLDTVGAGTQNAAVMAGGATVAPHQHGGYNASNDTFEYNGTSWNTSVDMLNQMQQHNMAGGTGTLISGPGLEGWSNGIGAIYEPSYVTGSITTNTDKGYNPFSQNPSGRYLLTKKLQANLSPSSGGTVTSGSSAGYGGGY